MFSQINVRTKSQNTWHLSKQSLHKYYQGYKGDIKFKTQSKQKTQEDETLAFQTTRMQTCTNLFEQNNGRTRIMHKYNGLNSFKNS